MLGANGACALEILHHKPRRRRGTPPLLFIHGAFAGAWCWEENFLPYFARQGFDSYAVSLRGHGESPNRTFLHTYRLCDYVNDIRSARTAIGRDPILIGHSMGGMVIQKFLESDTAPGVAMLASVPPDGLTHSSLQIAFEEPLLWVRLNRVILGDRRFQSLSAVANALFRDNVPEERLRAYAERFQPESVGALMDMTLYDLPFPIAPYTGPTLVVHGAEDALFDTRTAWRTARAYGAEPRILPSLPHAMMLDEDWESAAECVRDWLHQF